MVESSRQVFLVGNGPFLIAVRAISKPLHEGLKKIEDNMNQDFPKSRLSIEDLESFRSGVHTASVAFAKKKRVLM